MILSHSPLAGRVGLYIRHTPPPPPGADRSSTPNLHTITISSSRQDISTSTMSSVDATGGEKKTSWPEVVGLPAEEAKKIILKDMPDADVVVLPAGSPVTMDWRSNRVRVFVDTVAQTPTVG